MTQEQKQKIYETFMNKTSKKRRLNEDFLDNVSADDIKRQDDSLENPDYIMQDGRPVSELLNDYMCCVHTCINFDFMVRIKALCTRLRQLTERLPFNLDVSPVIISYGLTEDQWRNANFDTGFLTYEKYLMGHTEDQGGKKHVHLFMGIKLNGGLSYTKAFDVVYMISKIVFSVIPMDVTTEFEFIYHAYSYDMYYFQRDGRSLVMKMREAIECVTADEEPNSHPIDCLTELFCTICNVSYRESWKLHNDGYEDFIYMMREHMRKRSAFH